MVLQLRGGRSQNKPQKGGEPGCNPALLSLDAPTHHSEKTRGTFVNSTSRALAGGQPTDPNALSYPPPDISRHMESREGCQTTAQRGEEVVQPWLPVASDALANASTVDAGTDERSNERVRPTREAMERRLTPTRAPIELVLATFSDPRGPVGVVQGVQAHVLPRSDRPALVLLAQVGRATAAAGAP